ncbi:GNAT family N-acetyltransferase [Marinoscillum pacificum]|uniref:GNAT family N-acetyltransferase n=1 Tax=Marinoscillum pacificum TaxID=392723 RepID=UPI00215795AF|nr:GNAT family N-acetyltransferase [Marinoscillum pacificum]
MKFITVDFDKKYNRERFSCSHDSLNNYLKRQATKESKAGLAKVYLLVNTSNEVIGYYSLSSSELPKDCIPDVMLKKLPKGYTGYPAILLGRLAVTKNETGKGLGGELLVDAIHRCVIHSLSIGTCVIMIDPIDESATKFYEKFMFKRLPDSDRMLLHIDFNLRSHFGLE